MWEVLQQDRFTRWVFAGACLFVLLMTRPQPTGHHDRARFATVEALIDHGTWSIEPSRFDTIDKVQRHGKLYASKPPMMPALMAGVYAMIKHSTGRTFGNAQWLVVKLLVVICIGVPYLFFVLAWASFLNAVTDRRRWAYRFCLLAGAFGHYVFGYSIMANNHTMAAVALFFAFYHQWMLDMGHRSSLWHLSAAGFFAGLAPTLELPAAVASVGLFVAAVARFGPRTTWNWFVPAAILPLSAHFVLNLIATGGSLLPFYLIGDYHYPGSYWNNPMSFDTLNEPKLLYTFQFILGHHGVLSLTPLWLFSLWGAWTSLRDPDSPWRPVALILSASVLIAAPYFVFKTGNYGGGAHGFRWLFWLTPMWLLLLIPAAQKLRGRAMWSAAAAALAFSVFTALFVSHDPWGMSPLHMLFNRMGWIDY